ncbi:SDR family NAD(P)-dependent oxidoreductase [Paenibacillus kobensis]|uniref:SDR family NAD(P)-dependent oxidoreductase n=1 Tax=Paenibacillus kobensis TaxID=59841 RepID=UPI000FD9A5DE
MAVDRIGKSNLQPDIAIIGIACRLPGADHYESLWDNLAGGVHSVTELSKDRWDTAQYYSPDPNEPNKSVSKWCGQIGGVKQFDNQFFQISPREARNMDPQQRLLLEEAWHCMEDSGVALTDLQEKITSVYIGVMTGDYKQEALSANADVESYACLGNYEGMLANRISHVFQLRGASSSLNAACASSLIAIHEAKRSLRSGESDYAIAGGVNLNLHPWKYIAFSKSRMLSPSGVCRTFDKDADGYVPGDGVGLVLMQRLEDAVRDGNHVYGIVKGSAVNHVGRSLTITAPSVESQRDMILSAYKDAGLSPKSTTYVEAHGTGTSLGDPIEIEGLTQAFRQFTDRTQYCKIGSIKTNIGHLEAAAGVAGIIKVLLMMKHRQIPPSLHVKHLNPIIDFKRSPFEVALELSPWEAAGGTMPLLAGVSSLGFGGVNAHVVLEEAPKAVARRGSRRPPVSTAEPHVFVLSAKTDEALGQQMEEWRTWLESGKLRDTDWRDISYTLLTGRTAMSRRIAACVRNTEELQHFLKTAQASLAERGSDRLTCLRIGELQWTGYRYAGQLSRHSASFRQELASVTGLVKNRLGRESMNGFKDDVWDENARPLFSFVVAYALLEAWKSSGLTVDRITGEQSGVWAALAHSGMVKAEQAAAFLSGSMEISDIKLLRPESDFYDWVNDRVMERFSFQEGYLQKLVHGIGTDESFGILLQEWMDKSRLLIGNQFTFRKFVGEWEESFAAAFGCSLFELVSGPNPWLASDSAHRNRDRVLGLILLSSFRKLNRKWDLTIRSEGSDPLLEELADLVEDGIVSKETAVGWLTENETALSDTVSDMNSRVHMINREREYTLLKQHNRSVPEIVSLADWIGQLTKEWNGNQTGETHGEMQIRMVTIGTCGGSSGELFYHADETVPVLETLKKFATQLWLGGWRLRWDRLLPFYGAKKVPLPVYSFKRQSHWWEQKDKQQRAEGMNTAAETVRYQTLYHQLVWKQAASLHPVSASVKPVAGSVILLDDTEALAESLRAKIGSGAVVTVKAGGPFRQTGEWSYEINPSDEHDFALLLEQLTQKGIGCDTIIHNWARRTANAEVMSHPFDEEQLNRGIHSLFALTKAYYSLKQAGPVRLLYLYAKEGQEWPAHAAAAGMFRTLRQENAKLRYTLLEHPPVLSDGGKAEMIAEALSYENAAGCEMSFRDGHWFERSAEEMESSGIDAGTSIRLKNNGVYLISGGAGGLGYMTARHIASQVRAKLVLAGRSAWKEELAERLDELKRLGSEAVYVQADVSSLQETQRLVQYAKEQFGELNGIIHCAGIYGSGFAYKRTREQIEAVIAPKAAGAVHLDDAASGEALDFFLLFSSISGVIGDIGLSDYAYCNSFLDYFAELREEMRKAGDRSGRTLSIDWPLWQDGGIQIGEREADRYRDATAQEILPSREGMLALDTLMATASGHQALVSYGDADRIRAIISRNYEASKLAGESATAELSSNHHSSKPESRQGSVRTGNTELLGRTKDLLTGMLAAELGLPESDIDPSAPFEQFGIDSILIHHVNARLESALGPISKTLLFEYSTVLELSGYLVMHHSEELAKLLGLLLSNQAEAASAMESTDEVLHTEETDGTPVRHAEGLPHRAEAPMNAYESENDAAFRRQDIAIVGAAGRYPNADNLAKLWDNLVRGADCVSSVPTDRWDAGAYYDADPARSAEGTMYCKSGGFIDDVDKFDPLFFKLSPKEAELMDPQERLFLETAWSAFEDAGYSAQTLLESTGGGKCANVGVFVGVTTNSYSLFGPDLWRQHSGSIPLSMPWSIANRVSYVMNFDGPSMPVDTACASSLSAVAMACDSIWNGDCRMALAGGVNLYLHPSKFVWLSQMRMISPSGKCFTFSDQADGFGPGEGVGAVVLKPLSDAIRDQDQIYAVIKSAAVNHGGKTNGYTVPNPNAQASLVAKALRKANIHPRTVSYIEAHGTGTLLGDPIEITGLTKAFREGTDETQFCAIGSVKTNIGHLESAAGIAGLTKLLLQMKHRTLVPSLHAERLNPNIDFANSPFYVQRTASEWKRPVIEEDGIRTEYPRRAGISSFGAGGANVHVILEEYIPPEAQSTASVTNEGPQLVVLSAKSKEQLRQYAKRLAVHLAADSGGVKRNGTIARPQAGQPLDSATAGVELTEDMLLQRIASRIGIAPVGLDTSVPLAEYGLDPHDCAALSEEIGRELAVTVSPTDMLAAASIRTIVERLLAPSTPHSDMLLHAPEEAAATEWMPKRRVSLADIAYTTQIGRAELEERAAFAAHDLDDLLIKLQAYAGGNSGRGVYEDNIRSGKARIDLLQGEAGSAFKEHVLSQGDLDVIAKLWTSGLSIDWARLHGGVRRQRVSLPTYPFARERYWIPAVSVSSTAANAVSLLTPAPARIPTFEQKRTAYVLQKRWLPSEWTGEASEPIRGITVVIVNKESERLLAGIRFERSPIVVRAEGKGTLADSSSEFIFNPASVEEGAALAERIVQANPVTGLLDMSDLYDGRQDSDTGKSGIRALLQTMLIHRRHEPFRLLHLTNGLQALETERPTMAGAATAGFAKMLGAEYVKVHSTTVDIDFVIREESGAALHRIISREWESAQSEGEAVYRKGQRYVPVVTEAAEAGVAGEASLLLASIQADPLRPIVITGGLRGIGAEIAKHLAANKARRLVLMGLQPMPPRSEWDRLPLAEQANRHVRERIELVMRLEEAGAEVELYSGPLTDRSALGGFLHHIRDQWGSIGGVIHCAGSNRNDHPAFINKQEQAVATVMEPKTEGLHILHELLQGERLSYFILFSSISAVIPELASGLSDYAAANSYMDHFAAYQHAQGNTYFRSINWPSWSEVGMGEVKSGSYRSTGLLTHTTEEGLSMLHAVMSKQAAATYIPCMAASGEQLDCGRWLLVKKPAEPSGSGISGPHQAAAASSSREHRGEALILAKLRQLFAEGLRLDPAKMDSDTPFGDFGMESVLLNDMVCAIDRWAGTKLDPTVLLEYPTLGSLSRYLAGQIGPMDSDSFSEEEYVAGQQDEQAHPREQEPSHADIQDMRQQVEQALDRIPASISAQESAKERADQPLAERLAAVSPATPARPLNGTDSTQDTRIAVIGMAGHFPGAKDVDEFWRNLASGTCSITEVPASRWPADRLYSPKYERGKSISKWGGFIDGIEQFDPAYFGLNEQEAEQFDPLIRQFLEVATDTIRYAGYEAKELSGRKVGVFVGSRAGDFAPKLGLPTKGTILGIGQNFIAAHLAHFYNLKGPNLVVDTACSSSLVSVHLACQSLIIGESELAIAGGVDILLDEKPYLILSEAKALSPDGRCHTFDEKANGFVPGEGCGAVMLKRLDRAVRDGDRIYAVIDASAVNNDGRTMGVTTPNPAAQQEVIADAMAKGGIDPSTVSYVETHGTGTMIGDPIELRALTSVFRSAAEENQYCAVGSVKTNVGHLLSAAGIASLIKVVLSLGNRQIPPTLHCETPNPRFQFSASPFYPAAALQDWKPRNGIRRAGISSFGFGGTNAHLIVSDYQRTFDADYAVVRQPLPAVTFNRQRYWVQPEQSEPAVTARHEHRMEPQQDVPAPFLQMERIQ